DGIRDRNVTGVQTCALPISALPRTFWVAGTGPRPITSGANPAEPAVTIRARGVRLYFSTAAAEATIIADAPSLRLDEFPAVTTSPSCVTGRRLASFSTVVPG